MFALTLKKLIILNLACAVILSCSKKESRSKSQRSLAISKNPEDIKSENLLLPSHMTVEDIPTFTGVDSKQLQTASSSSLKKLKFQAGSGDGQFLKEYLLVITAHEPSCLRLKTPDDKTVSEYSCPGHTSGTPTPGPKYINSLPNFINQPTTSPIGGDLPTGLTPEERLAYLQTHPPKMNLADETSMAAPQLELCATQNINFINPALEADAQATPTLSKLAYLVHKTVHTALWVDAEVGNPCRSGSPDDLPSVNFSPLVKQGRDELKLQHLKSLGDEAENIYQKLAGNFGDFSDLDHNGLVHIVLSPEVNRSYLSRYASNSLDLFAASPIVKMEDLDLNAAHPLSNHGEYVYLWAPDPQGAFSHGQFLSSTSLISQYAKGYIAQQLMTLLLFNQQIISSRTPESTWLSTSMSLLASAYAAGNDYSFDYVTQYLSSRSHYVSLTQSVDDSFVPSSFAADTRIAQLGLRSLFAWYVHARLCPQSLDICPKMKTIIDQGLSDVSSIELALGEKFPQILEKFSLSLALALVHNPTQVKGRLGTLASSYVDFPLSENLSTQVIPSRDQMSFQIKYPNTQLDLSLAKDSVSFVILTAFDQDLVQLDAYMGAHVAMQVIPLADREISQRALYMEKNTASLDQRSVNLTDIQDEAHLSTYDGVPEGHDQYVVSQNKELWILGNIENFYVSYLDGNGEKTVSIADTDSYTLKIDPCKDSDDESVCRRNPKKSVLIQMLPLEQDLGQISSVDPAILVTTPSLTLFRGQNFLPRKMSVIEPGSQAIVDEVVPVLCQSELSLNSSQENLSSIMSRCANAGLSTSGYEEKVCGRSILAVDGGACLSSAPKQSVSYDLNSYVAQNYNDKSPVFDNYLHSGPKGFPSLNYGHMDSIKSTVERSKPSTFFDPEEIYRQFLRFAYTKEAKAQTYTFYPVWGWDGSQVTSKLDLSSHLSSSSVKVAKFFDFRQKLLALTGTVSKDSMCALISSCQKNMELISPQNFCVNPIQAYKSLEDKIKDSLKSTRVTCVIPSSASLSKSNLSAAFIQLCPELLLTKTQTLNFTLASDANPLNGISCPSDGKGPQINTQGTDVSQSQILTPQAQSLTVGSWVDNKQVIFGSDTYSGQNWTSYYKPLFPHSDIGTFCLGDQASVSEQYPCAIDSGDSAQGDLRYQLNVAKDLFSTQCSEKELRKDFLACVNTQAFDLAIEPDRFIAPAFSRKSSLATNLPVTKNTGELIGKSGQLGFVSFLIPTQGSSILQVLVGGMRHTQGRYLLRVRVLDELDLIEAK